ncbi:MAG: tRNA (N6-isopentenyl adenosine(37)-C2)-methylthiotransferase MiaB [candidate division Zixibacteria bacterium]|nr:tRNA (N6-isopentenyl adenosine(37)-C2)-methylthiotransferase MiaB [candidate division Zixibacteria bacterium]
MKKTYYLHSYGCQMNLADSGVLAAAMEGAGYVPVADPGQAGIIILNTCSVREKAEERALGRLRELAHLKRTNGAALCAIGCMAQRLGSRLLEQIPELDIILGTERLFLLPELLAEKNGAPVVDIAAGDNPAWAEYPPAPDNPFSGHVIITRGCNNYCAYCIVPYLRGPERHRSPEAVLRDVAHLAAHGVSEVTLVGQNVNSYCSDGLDFAGLLRRVAAETAVKRIRFITSHPKDISDGLIRLFAEEPKVMGHVHLPLQSGSDRILGLMSRGYTLEHYRRRVDRLRQARPDIAVTTDLIVGFPTETDREYAATLEAVRQIAFDAAFMFRYSVREGTWAAQNLPDDVPEATKLERLAGLIALQKQMSYDVNQKEVGRVRQVLIDGVSRRDRTVWKGKTEGNKTILVSGGADLLGRIVPVRVARADSWTLYGELKV